MLISLWLKFMMTVNLFTVAINSTTVITTNNSTDKDGAKLVKLRMVKMMTIMLVVMCQTDTKVDAWWGEY